MKENHPVLSGLFKLHADLGGQIKANRDHAAKLAADILHVEAVIEMYAPRFNVRRIAPKRRNRGNKLARATMTAHFYLASLAAIGKNNVELEEI